VIRPFGEAALLVELGSPERAQALAASLRATPIRGVLEAVPGLETVLVELAQPGADPDALVPALEDRVASLGAAPGDGRAAHVIRVVYDGPDLADVADLTGLTTDEVVALHTSVELRVLFCGFAPGFAYLGDLPPRLEVDRLETPRTRTPAGSVAIAGRMSGIYPADLPGGWRVIGRTDLTLFDPRRDPPVTLLPGDRVRFEAAR
jgi:KipI family sensor histidine kinase inhibitor